MSIEVTSALWSKDTVYTARYIVSVAQPWNQMASPWNVWACPQYVQQAGVH